MKMFWYTIHNTSLVMSAEWYWISPFEGYYVSDSSQNELHQSQCTLFRSSVHDHLLKFKVLKEIYEPSM